MPSFNERSQEIEIMDNLNCSGEVVNQTLKEIEFINKVLGGNSVTTNGIKKLLKYHSKKEPISIIDMGCGSGDMLKKIDLLLRKMGFEAYYLLGIDANPFIIEHARKNCEGFENISFETADVLQLDLSKKVPDIITSTLFTHHFNQEQLTRLFKEWKNASMIGVVINDLHRHPFAYFSIKLFTLLFSKSKMVKYDAPLSVLRGFHKDELKILLEKNLPPDYKLKWKWAFRWQLIF